LSVKIIRTNFCNFHFRFQFQYFNFFLLFNKFF
jgi:hypothetical protein